MKDMPMRGQRTATNKASKAKAGTPAKTGAGSKKMPPALLMMMMAKGKAKK